MADAAHIKMQDNFYSKKIAIIGAGWAGIGCWSVLNKAGHQVDVYERNDDIGGVWHPINAYSGLMIHQACRGVEYYDFPMPNHIDKTERIPSEEVFDYLKSYCFEKNMYSSTKFKVNVTKISYFSKTKKSILHFIDEKGVQQQSIEYDYIIYTNGFSNRRIPNFPDKQNFSGKILHSFDAEHSLIHSFIRENKKITVLGASKSATDMIIHFYRCGYKVDWLYRKPYWFFRFDPHHDLLKAKSHGKNHTHFFYKFLMVFGYYMAPAFPRLVFWLWRSFGIIHTFDKNYSNFNSFHLGWIDDSQMKILKEYNKEHGIQGEIKGFNKNGIYLKGGKHIESDVIICCTGSGNDKSDMIFEVDNEPFLLQTAQKVYRGRVIPHIPNLIFTAYHFFSLGTVNGLNNGDWIQKYITCDFSEKWLLQNALDHGYPFFVQQSVFESSKNIFAASRIVTEEFFHSGELNRFDYVKWFFSKYLFGYKGPSPLKFKVPRNFSTKK